LHEGFGYGNTDANPELKPNDVVLTPRRVAKEMIDGYDIPAGATILDPCKGDGAFLDQYPGDCETDWCEITEGRDFFDYQGRVDWIITNPPYSIIEEFMAKCFEVADDVALLIPMSKWVSSLRRIRAVLAFGNVVSIRIISASRCGFPFGFPACALHIRRGYDGPTEIREWE